MTSWEKYVKSNILRFREEYRKFKELWKRILETNRIAFLVSLNSPCQVVVIDFGEGESKCLIIVHDEKHSDMEVAFENVAFEDFSSRFLREIELLRSIDTREFQEIVSFVRGTARGYLGGHWRLFTKAFVGVTGDIRPVSKLLSDKALMNIDSIIVSIDKKEQRRRIKEAIEVIKKDAETIDGEKLRRKVMMNIGRLEKRIKEMNTKFEDSTNRLRRMIGTSEKYLDWKAFSSDIEHLKETHVTKGEFKSEIKRLGEKIDAVNVRIEDLKAIKFWSKRTLLEMALAIIAAIATLYGAGVIKF
jgi:hypothetical protein